MKYAGDLSPITPLVRMGLGAPAPDSPPDYMSSSPLRSAENASQDLSLLRSPIAFPSDSPTLLLSPWKTPSGVEPDMSCASANDSVTIGALYSSISPSRKPSGTVSNNTRNVRPRTLKFDSPLARAPDPKLLNAARKLSAGPGGAGSSSVPITAAPAATMLPIPFVDGLARPFEEDKATPSPPSRSVAPRRRRTSTPAPVTPNRDGSMSSEEEWMVRNEDRDSTQCKNCNCKKSRCLKLYCECFMAGIYCSNGGGQCQCSNCQNTPEYAGLVEETRRMILQRNPHAFKPKIVNEVHQKGCHCRKSACQKKYCECFQAGVPCTSECRCTGCKNHGPNRHDSSPSNGSLKKVKKKSTSPERRVLAKTLRSSSRITKSIAEDERKLVSKDNRYFHADVPKTPIQSQASPMSLAASLMSNNPIAMQANSYFV